MRYNLFCLLLSPLGWKLEDGRARPHTLSWLLCALKSHYAHASNSAFEALPSLHSDDLAKSSGARHLKMSQLVFLEKEAQNSFKYLDICHIYQRLENVGLSWFFPFLKGWFFIFYFLFFYFKYKSLYFSIVTSPYQALEVACRSILPWESFWSK